MDSNYERAQRNYDRELPDDLPEVEADRLTPTLAELQAKPSAKPFTSDLFIMDRDVLIFDGAEYCVRIYPLRRCEVEVRVTAMDNELTYWAETAADNAESINEKVFDCIQNCQEQEREKNDFLERQARLNLSDFDCRR